MSKFFLLKAFHGALDFTQLSTCVHKQSSEYTNVIKVILNRDAVYIQQNKYPHLSINLLPIISPNSINQYICKVFICSNETCIEDA